MKNTERFSDRVQNYVKYRPSYPAELIDTLVLSCGLNSTSRVADVGSGTGKLSELLLAQGCTVIGVEPNLEMRQAAEHWFADNENFVSNPGTADDTQLDNHSVDLITAAQAFHWFEPNATSQEFARILKPGGHVAIVWNQRDMTTEFHREYDAMLNRHCPDYRTVNHRNITDADLAAFFAPHRFELHTYPYWQAFDPAGFIGRLFSSSYTPAEGSAEAAVLTRAAEQLFDRHSSAGHVRFDYQTRLYLAKYEQ